MMRDALDRLLWVLLLLTLAGAVLVLAGERQGAGEVSGGIDKAMERQLAYQARVELLQKIYAPVDALAKRGELPSALLKLDELIRQYPQEAHGHILKGELLYGMGALEEALASYVRGVRLNGDYLDPKSPLSRRTAIEQVAEEGLRVIGKGARENPGNRSMASALKNVYYLRSRLAGGCE